jgi:hypothetical protein
VPVSRTNPSRVKALRTYSVQELAHRLGVHKNTIRNWQRAGLEPIDERRPVLFQGAAVRAFLTGRNAKRKRPCPPGTFYCFRCREPRPPALEMVDYLPVRMGSGNLCAICACCGTLMHRRVRRTEIGTAMPGCTVQFVEAELSLSGR